MSVNYYRARGPFTRKPGRLAALALDRANHEAWLSYARTLGCVGCGRTCDEVDGAWFTDRVPGGEFWCVDCE